MVSPPVAAKNQTMLIRPPPRQPKQTWLWYAPYAAIGIFALAVIFLNTHLSGFRKKVCAIFMKMKCGAHCKPCWNAMYQ